jgi:LuxR family transcriptional regulator, maltose regulon positive regulatory protein
MKPKIIRGKAGHVNHRMETIDRGAVYSLEAGKRAIKRRTAIAKITAPKTPRVYRRERLFLILDNLKSHSLTWISAPAGAGKTTLTASYLEAKGTPCVWYQVDERDSDLPTFFYYLGRACKPAMTRKKNRPLPVLTPEYQQGVLAFALRYFEDLHSRLENPLTIVFDNYQQVKSECDLHEILCRAVEGAPEHVRIIVISRETPPGQFSRLQAGGRMSVLPSSQIQFTLNESKNMLEGKGVTKLSRTTLVDLHKKTQGWAAGLILMIENGRVWNLNEKALLRVEPQAVFDYLASEVFLRIDEEARQFLLQTSFLPRMTAQIAEKVTGNKRSEEILSRLYLDNYFVQRDVGSKPFYQYHPLFREFLLARSRLAMSPEEARDIQGKSAELLEESLQIDDAADLLLKSGDWEKATAFVLRHAPSLRNTGRNRTIDEWLCRFPDQVVRQEPWLLYWRGLIRLSGDAGDSVRLFEGALDLFEKRKETAGALMTWCAAVDAIILESNDFASLDRWIDWLDGHVSFPLDIAEPELKAAVVTSMMGALAHRKLGRSDIDQWVEETRRVQEGAHPGFRMLASAYLSYYHFWAGKWESRGTKTWIPEKEFRLKESTPQARIFNKWIDSCMGLIVGSDASSAQRAATEGLEIARSEGIHLFDFAFYSTLVSSLLSEGRHAEALKELDAMASFVRGKYAQASYHYILSWHAYLTGDLEGGLDCARQSVAEAVASGMEFAECLCRTAVAELLFETGKREEAYQELSVALRMSETTGSACLAYGCNLAAARFAFVSASAGQKGQAALRIAMRIGREQSYLNFYWWVPSWMAGLCVKALEESIEVDYVRRLVKRHKLLPESPPYSCEQWPWPIKIHTLGAFRIIKEGERLTFQKKPQKKVLLLLKALIAAGPNGVAQESVCDRLWPDAEGDLAGSAFRMALSRLRLLLGSDKAVVSNSGKVKLDDRYCWVDTWAFESLATEVDSVAKKPEDDRRQGPAEADSARVLLARKAMQLYQGDFLSGEVDEAWMVPVRERLKGCLFNLVTKTGSFLEQTEHLEEAIELYERALKIYHLSEEVYQQLMVCQSRLGHPEEAVATYHRCRRALLSAVGHDPSRATEALHREIAGSIYQGGRR